jgi:hypothetical protein
MQYLWLSALHRIIRSLSVALAKKISDAGTQTKKNSHRQRRREEDTRPTQSKEENKGKLFMADGRADAK